MNDTLERDTVIDLLDRLGSEQDEDVLAAARTLHAQITNAGMHWQDLLVGDESEAVTSWSDRRSSPLFALSGFFDKRAYSAWI